MKIFPGHTVNLNYFARQTRRAVLSVLSVSPWHMIHMDILRNSVLSESVLHKFLKESHQQCVPHGFLTLIARYMRIQTVIVRINDASPSINWTTPLQRQNKSIEVRFSSQYRKGATNMSKNSVIDVLKAIGITYQDAGRYRDLPRFLF